MKSRKLNILLIFDVPYAPPNHERYQRFMKGTDWKDERDVIRALKALGHKVDVFGVFDDIFPLVDRLRENRPDVVFNMCESFNDDRSQEPNLTALLELMQIPYTGARPEALTLCKDKGLTKKLLAFHELRVPQFEISHRSHPKKRLTDSFRYPALCKPLDREGSEGLAQNSLVNSEEDCLSRLRFIHERLQSDAIVEEYIDGRELYVGVLGNDRLTVLPPQELFFKNLPNRTHRFLTYKAKWDQAYRKRYGIDSHGAKHLGARELEHIKETCKTIYRLFKLSGYARIDLRYSPEGELVFLEANPNPSIKRNDDFAGAARRAGISYEELLSRIVNLALAG